MIHLTSSVGAMQMPDSQNYIDIKALMECVPPKPMKAKYDRDGDGIDPQGSRKMWPMVLGHSDDPDPPHDPLEMVLCFQFTGSPSQRGWRCFKVALLSDIGDTSPNVPRPVMDDEDVERQSCVTDVEVP